LLSGCDPGIGLKVENKTAVPICVADAPVPAPCDEGVIVPPFEVTRISIVCTSDDKVHVSVARKDNGRLIHQSDATCGEWDKSGSKIVALDTGGGDIEAQASLDQE
jgi:hypothetical protein